VITANLSGSPIYSLSAQRKGGLLKVERQDMDNRQTQLTVELEDERLDIAMRSAAKRMGKNSSIPGFRPGKAPYEIILGRFGEDSIFEEALNRLGQEVYLEALDDLKLEPFAPGSLEEVISRKPLTLRYIVPLEPEVDLGAYHEIRLPFEKSEVEDEAVNQVLEDLRQRHALIEPADRPAKLSDVIVVDLGGNLLEAGENEDAVLLDRKGISILVDEETNWPIPGIADHLVGLEAGQEKSFEYTFPDDYITEDLRGKKAIFHLTCLEVKSRFVPEWSDELAHSVGDFEDLLALRIQIRKDLQQQAERQAEAEYANKVMDMIVEGAMVSFPPVLLQDEVTDMVRELEQRLKVQRLSLQDYLKIENKTEEALREELDPQARERLTRALVLGEIVQAEEITVDETEIDSEIDRILEQFEDKSEKTRKAFDNPAGRRRIRLDLLSRKAIKRVIAIAKGEAVGQEEAQLENTKSSEKEQEIIEQATDKEQE
jgi:trigger factor